MTYLSTEYKLTHCVQCGKPLADHRRITAQDVANSQLATWNNPVDGWRAPLADCTIGQWIGHTPMPWILDSIECVTLVYKGVDSEGHDWTMEEEGRKDQMGRIYCRSRAGYWIQAVGSLKPAQVIPA